MNKQLRDIKEGDVFFVKDDVEDDIDDYNKTLFMKIELTRELFDAIRLKDGILFAFGLNTIVCLCPAHMFQIEKVFKNEHKNKKPFKKIFRP